MNQSSSSNNNNNCCKKKKIAVYVENAKFPTLCWV